MNILARFVSAVSAVTAIASLASAQNIGQEYCSSNTNSSGQVGQLEAFGVPEITSGNVILLASRCPANKPLLMFYGPNATSTPLGAGTLCISPASGGITRILPVLQTDANGQVAYSLTSAQLSGPFGGTGFMPTMNYQAWFRDPAAGAGVNNLTSAIRIAFLPCTDCQ